MSTWNWVPWGSRNTGKCGSTTKTLGFSGLSSAVSKALPFGISSRNYPFRNHSWKSGNTRSLHLVFLQSLIVIMAIRGPISSMLNSWLNWGKIRSLCSRKIFDNLYQFYLTFITFFYSLYQITKYKIQFYYICLIK